MAAIPKVGTLLKLDWFPAKNSRFAQVLRKQKRPKRPKAWEHASSCTTDVYTIQKSRQLIQIISKKKGSFSGFPKKGLVSTDSTNCKQLLVFFPAKAMVDKLSKDQVDQVQFVLFSPLQMLLSNMSTLCG
jgi:hypothetical protein